MPAFIKDVFDLPDVVRGGSDTIRQAEDQRQDVHAGAVHLDWGCGPRSRAAQRLATLTKFAGTTSNQLATVGRRAAIEESQQNGSQDHLDSVEGRGQKDKDLDITETHELAAKRCLRATRSSSPATTTK